MKKIAVGQRWRTRGGEEVVIFRYRPDVTPSWHCSNGHFVSETGNAGSVPHPIDLIELLEEGLTPWAGDEQPAETKGKQVRVFMRGGITDDDACADEFRWGHSGLAGDIIAYKVVQPAESPTAPDLLDHAAGHMRDRGERSMAQTVAIFNLHHGTALTEAQGWHFMQILKDVRLFTGTAYHADSAEDCIAYARLKAEALAKGGAA